MTSINISEAYEDAGAKHGALGRLSEDEELQQSVCEALIEDTELDSTAIGVRAKSGVVVLSGSVKNEEARRRALTIAESQRGVREVHADDLRIA